MTNENEIQLAITPFATLSIDAVQQAKSGHPGTPMAPRAFGFIRSGPCDCGSIPRTNLANRDRFVLSNGTLQNAASGQSSS